MHLSCGGGDDHDIPVAQIRTRFTEAGESKRSTHDSPHSSLSVLRGRWFKFSRLESEDRTRFPSHEVAGSCEGDCHPCVQCRYSSRSLLPRGRACFAISAYAESMRLTLIESTGHSWAPQLQVVPPPPGQTPAPLATGGSNCSLPSSHRVCVLLGLEGSIFG